MEAAGTARQSATGQRDAVRAVDRQRARQDRAVRAARWRPRQAMAGTAERRAEILSLWHAGTVAAGCGHRGPQADQPDAARFHDITCVSTERSDQTARLLLTNAQDPRGTDTAAGPSVVR